MKQRLTSDPDYPALAIAFEAAREAGKLIQEMARRGISTSRKADLSVVTEADLAADALITSRLAEAFPTDGILSEESGSSTSERETLWIVDPIDGTKAYAAGIPGYSVMIGRLTRSQPTLGVVYNPVTDTSYFALSGAGAWFVRGPQIAEAERAHVSQVDAIAEMRMITTPSMSAAQRALALSELGLREGPTVNSVGVKVGLLITGHGEVYYSRHKLSYWDTAAPVIIAREGGARATLLDGSEISYALTSPSHAWEHHAAVLITNGHHHDDLRTRFLALTDRIDGGRR